MSTTETKTQFSIVLAVQDQAEALRLKLPALLSQDYHGGYEVIVVDESSTDETADLLKQLANEHSHLYTTFVPKYHFQKNRRRLALTIGVKAAKGRWIVFTDVNSPTPSAQWLAELEPFAQLPTTLLLGYVRRKTGDVRLQPFASVDGARRQLTTAERTGGKGHQGRLLRYVRGKYDFAIVAAQAGHDALRYYGISLHGWSLLKNRLLTFAHNLAH